MEWISVKDRLPPEGIEILIKTYDLNDHEIHIPAIFTIYDIDKETEAYGWKIGRADTIAKPTHWMPLPEPPPDENPTIDAKLIEEIRRMIGENEIP